MAQRITKKLTFDVRYISCSRPFCLVWFDRLGRPGSWVFEKVREYELPVERAERYAIPLQSSHTLRGMVGMQGAMSTQAEEAVTVWTDQVTRENAKALDAIRHAQICFQYDPDAGADYLQWRRVYPEQSPANRISERWDYASEIQLSFTYDPVTNF